jgi:hypothetical protein
MGLNVVDLVSGAGFDLGRLGVELLGHQPEPCRGLQVEAIPRPAKADSGLFAQIGSDHGLLLCLLQEIGENLNRSRWLGNGGGQPGDSRRVMRQGDTAKCNSESIDWRVLSAPWATNPTASGPLYGFEARPAAVEPSG